MAQAGAILKDNFKRIGEASLDERKRISLAKTLETLKQILGPELDNAIRFGVYVNDAGQVLLSPEVSVPIHELWLYRGIPRLCEALLRVWKKPAKVPRLTSALSRNTQTTM